MLVEDSKKAKAGGSSLGYTFSWGCSSVVGHLPRICGALSTILNSTTKHLRRKEASPFLCAHRTHVSWVDFGLGLVCEAI